MKKGKKLICLVLAATMMLTMLTGCGNGSKNTTIWKIGGIGPTTGDNSAYGLGVKNAIELAVSEINDAGGINGFKIEYKFEDDVTDNEKSVNAYNSLKDWGMNILVGCVTSGCCLAVAGRAETDNMFQLTPSASASDCANYSNVFQVCFTDPNQGSGSAQYIGDHAMASKVAIIYNSSDVYSTGIYEKFVVEAKNQPFEIVSTEAFTEDSKTDFTVQIQKAKEAGAELIFLPIYYQEATLILTQTKGMDYAPIFFGCDGIDGILTGVEGFDKSLAEGVILLTPFAADAKDDYTVKFVTAYQEKYGVIPNQFAADAYDAVYILKDVIEQSGAVPADGVSGICDKLKVAMTEITHDGLTGESMTWSTNGEVNKAPKAMKIINGVYSLME